MSFRESFLNTILHAFGPPSRRTTKVVEWRLGSDQSVVLQLDQPKGENAGIIWLPYPPDGSAIPETAVEYPGEAGRHSNTYPAPGLGKGLPALRVTVDSQSMADRILAYLRAMHNRVPLPEVKADRELTSSANTERTITMPVSLDEHLFPPPPKPAPRREAIPRTVQREVWQRDGGKCVECGTREKLCFDHIVPFSRGGSNTIRNLQLLCERCNCSKGNRI